MLGLIWKKGKEKGTVHTHKRTYTHTHFVLCVPDVQPLLIHKHATGKKADGYRQGDEDDLAPHLGTRQFSITHHCYALQIYYRGPPKQDMKKKVKSIC